MVCIHHCIINYIECVWMSFAVCRFVESTIEKEREKGFLFGEGLPKKLKKPKKLAFFCVCKMHTSVIYTHLLVMPFGQGFL